MTSGETPGETPRRGQADMHIHSLASDGTASAAEIPKPPTSLSPASRKYSNLAHAVGLSRCGYPIDSTDPKM